MNVNEWGVVFLFSTGFDLSGFSSLQIVFTKPDGSTLTKAYPSVTAPSVDRETTEGFFPQDTYASYTFVNGDVDQEGEWSARVIYNDAGQHLISDSGTFTIGP